MRQALEGVRILDNGIVQAGTFPARLLADFGAEIIRVENYRKPDAARNAPVPDATPGSRYWEQGGTYHEQHRNKDFCVGLDVTRPAGREVFLQLAEQSDVVLDSHPPGVLARLRLGYDDLRAVKPDIVFVSTSGYGYGGPYSNMRSLGMLTELMGVSWFNGYPGEGPRRGTIPLTDHPTTLHIAFLVLAGLARRERTGKAVWIDVSQYEVGLALAGDGYVGHALGAPVPTRIGNAEPGVPLSGCFPCSGDDEWVTLSVCTSGQWTALCGLIQREEWGTARDPASMALSPDARREIDTAVAAWTRRRSPRDCAAVLAAAGIPASPVSDVRDLLLDPHLEARGFFCCVEHAPEQERVGVRAFPGPSARLGRTPGAVRVRAPMLGEHNHAIITGFLGYTEAAYTDLVESGAVGARPAMADMVLPTLPTAERIQLSAWAGFARAKEFDRRFIERLQERFGPSFGPPPLEETAEANRTETR